MNADLKPYPAYKDSGVPWLGEVPEHWDIKSLESLVSSCSERRQPNLPLLSVVRERGVIPRASMADHENHNYIPDDLSNYKVVRQGNLVINKMKAWQGSLGVSEQDGIVSPAYYVYDFQVANLRFGHMLLRSKPYVAFFAQSSEGVRIGQWDLSVTGMKRIPVVLPPLPEQSAIVRFLDHIDRRIRRSIRTRQKLIKLLEEQKQAIIHLAVTRGLDPNVRLKPSGVEWLGEVPEHWAIKKLKAISPRISGRLVYSPAQYFCESGVPFLFGKNITERGFSFEKVKFIPHEINERFKHHTLREGDLVMVRVGAPGLTTVVPIEADGLNCASMMIIRKDPGFNSKWLAYVLNSRIGQMQVDIATYGAAQVQINITDAVNFLIPTPPLNEQNQIADYIDRQISKILSIVPSINTSIKFLREYRTRLIADVVTGKVDVRHIPLPDESNIETIFGEDVEPLDNETCALDEVECAVEIEE
ncbi:MAG: Type I restriction-modification system, S subunit [Synergistales bacterium 57_84]|nr:MAG: Type I restriction-modification system, S subunit [Synergistales bacterium 57_84]KUK89937.1 MAG: Restriction endonuclease S subunit [Marinimicrobia bacterium 46_43]